MADEIIFMDEGKIVERATDKELFNKAKSEERNALLGRIRV